MRQKKGSAQLCDQPLQKESSDFGNQLKPGAGRITKKISSMYNSCVFFRGSPDVASRVFRTLVRSIMHTLKALIWALLLLFLVAPGLNATTAVCKNITGVGHSWLYQRARFRLCFGCCYFSVLEWWISTSHLSFFLKPRSYIANVWCLDL